MGDQDEGAEDRAADQSPLRSGGGAEMIQARADSAESRQQREHHVGGLQDAEDVPGDRAVDRGDQYDEYDL